MLISWLIFFVVRFGSYLDTFKEEAEIDWLAVRHKRLELQGELKILEVEMEGCLKELGYGA